MKETLWDAIFKMPGVSGLYFPSQSLSEYKVCVCACVCERVCVHIYPHVMELCWNANSHVIPPFEVQMAFGRVTEPCTCPYDQFQHIFKPLTKKLRRAPYFSTSCGNPPHSTLSPLALSHRGRPSGHCPGMVLCVTGPVWFYTTCLSRLYSCQPVGQASFLFWLSGVLFYGANVFYFPLTGRQVFGLLLSFL